MEASREEGQGYPAYRSLWVWLLLGWVVAYLDRTITGPVISYLSRAHGGPGQPRLPGRRVRYVESDRRDRGRSFSGS